MAGSRVARKGAAHVNVWAAAVHAQTNGCRGAGGRVQHDTWEYGKRCGGATAKGRGARMQGAWEQGRAKEPVTREEAKRAGKKGGGRRTSVCATRLKKGPPT